MLNTLLEVAGFGLIIGFCVVVWWPAALLLGGLGLLVAAGVRDNPTAKVRPLSSVRDRAAEQ